MSVALLLDQIDTEAVVQNWVAKASGGEDVDHRDKYRLPFFNPATLRSGLYEKNVMCRNISEDGIGIIEFGRPENFQRATLAVSLHKRIVHLTFDLKWVEEIGSGWWVSGGEFGATSIRGASWIVLQLSSMVERRIHRRYSFCHPFVIYPNLEFHKDCVAVENIPIEAEESAFSLDVSRGGMRLLCSKPIDFDKEFIYVRKPDTMTLLRGRIVASRELDNGYSVLSIKFPTT